MGVGPLIIRSENAVAEALFYSMAAPTDVQRFIAGEFLGPVSIAPPTPADPHSNEDHRYIAEPYFGISDIELSDPYVADRLDFDRPTCVWSP